MFTTGGIGPTHDDITAECVAKAFGRPLIRHPEALSRLEAHYERTGIELNEARLRMADTPEGAELIDNPVSSAPGFRVENVHVLAGVPRICQAMFDGIKHTLEGRRPGVVAHGSVPPARRQAGGGPESDPGPLRPGGDRLLPVLPRRRVRRGGRPARNRRRALAAATDAVADLVCELGRRRRSWTNGTTILSGTRLLVAVGLASRTASRYSVHRGMLCTGWSLGRQRRVGDRAALLPRLRPMKATAPRHGR